jgi:N6-adenosine-specific RNA methylase IME4
MKCAARCASKTLTDEKTIRSALRLVCSNGKREQQPQEAPPCPEGAYTLILADPPWQYDFAETDNRAIENQYVTEAVEGIIRLKPKTADDCILFMWASAPKLIEAMQVMAGWGFEYRTHAMWDKEKIGMGYWFRGQHELLMVGTKGSVHPPQEGDRVGSVFREPREGHSVKPECVYEWIERSFPGFVKLEMFARRERDGWALWGNEV